MTKKTTSFDQAVDAIINGQEERLLALLKKNPSLVSERSPADHQCTLLHYLSSNGIEEELQICPPNAVNIGKILLEKGADVNALAHTYGGGSGQTTLNLLVSSYHPFKMGVQSDLIHLLAHYGAKLNGIEDENAPLGLALSFGYKEAAETLSQLGANHDNLIYEAGLGNLEAVKSFFYEDGNLKPAATNFKTSPKEETGRFSWPPSEKADPKAIALIYACLHGRNKVIEYLLEMGVSPDASISYDQTGLHYAAYQGYIDTVKLLLDHDANPSIRERQFHKTPIDWAAEVNEYGVIKVLNLYVDDEHMKQFSHAASVFPVDDVAATAKFYEEKLGFTINFLYGEPPTYAVLKRKDVGIHFCKKEDNFKPSSNHIALYVFVYDVDGLYKDLLANGVEITNPIADRDYGMRDFDIKDPNGYLIAFGCGI